MPDKIKNNFNVDKINYNKSLLVLFHDMPGNEEGRLLNAFCWYFVFFNREILNSARELQCSRQSVLLASIDVEMRAKIYEVAKRKTIEQFIGGNEVKREEITTPEENAYGDDDSNSYINRISHLYEELLQKSSLVSLIF